MCRLYSVTFSQRNARNFADATDLLGKQRNLYFLFVFFFKFYLGGGPWTRSILHRLEILDIYLISIYTVSDLGVLSNLIGSLSLANEHYSPPTE